MLKISLQDHVTNRREFSKQGRVGLQEHSAVRNIRALSRLVMRNTAFLQLFRTKGTEFCKVKNRAFTVVLYQYLRVL